MPRRIHRRSFLGALGSGAALASSLPSPLGRSLAWAFPANERIRVGVIGVGGLGRGYHIDNIRRLPQLELVAVADVDGDHLDQAQKKLEGKAKGYRDYRHILDRHDIDAVAIATPDHWHSLQAIHACQAGKDVYCEKPLSLTVAEGRAMVQAARRYHRVLQTGTQQRSSSQFRWACELVRNGRIGELSGVKVVLGKAPTSKFVADCNAPESLDWNFWLGPAPWVAYNPKRCHYTFRWFFDYSGGKLTDWGAHHLDIVQWALDSELSGPVEVEAKGRFPADSFYEAPVEFDVHYRYAKGVKVHTTAAGENGITFYGSEGEVFVSRSGIRATPEEILTEHPLDSGPTLLVASHHHHENWVECLRSRKRPISDVEIGHRSASVAHIGNIAMKLGRKLRWDPEAERFLGDPAANRYLQKPMRDPWSL